MITAVGGNGNKWKWAFYPKKEDQASAQRGEATGTRDQAVAACKSAIDAWRDSKNSN